MKHFQEEQKKSKNLRSIFMASILFFVAGSAVIIIALFNNQSELKEQARIDQETLKGEQLEIYEEIEQNLAEITAHENLVRLNFNSPEQTGPLSPRERIDQEIAIIADLIRQNNSLIAHLERKLDENNGQLADFESKNKSLERKLTKFANEIDALQKKNEALAQERDNLKNEKDNLTNALNLRAEEIAVLGNTLVGNAVLLDEKNTEIENLNTEINTTYYVVGNYKELKELNVVEKEGGIIGIGSAKELKDDFDKSQFISIDKLNYTTIPVFSKDAELATTHPTSSYRWVEDEDQVRYLEILNPIEFWESSSYLVILTAKETNFLKSA